MKYLLRLSYLGTDFRGFQVQKKSDARTVQKVLCEAAEKLFCGTCLVTGCSRTDSGVHALDYAATLETDSETSISCGRLPRALNSKLPDDVKIRTAEEVSADYAVRKHVLQKEYEYLILNSAEPSPFWTDRAWHYGLGKLEEERMNKAASFLAGEHDFRCFMASGSTVENTVRNVRFCTADREGDFLRIRIQADGFLYNMVRIIVGTLVEVSEGKIQPEEIATMLESGRRSEAGRTAPPQGLYLKKVDLF